MPAHSEESLLRGNCEANGFSRPVISKDDIVITGLSGRLPESDNIEEFRRHLVNGDDMVTEDNRRWEPGMHGLPKRSGKLKDISKFDASFFGVHPKQANGMDPQLRLLLEVTYEAIVDAGVNPQSVRGSRTGVFIGCSASESHDAWSNDIDRLTGYEMTGCTRSMFANRLSFFFDLKGPSYAVDTACSSSLLALDQALQAIRLGLCDAAIVGGSSLCLKPATTAQFQKLGMLAPDGTCKSFDASGNGYCRSEAVVVVYLQKSKDAKRVYATMVHSKNNTDGHKEQGITFPSGDMQKRLLLEVYNEAGVDPSAVSYVELHGTGTKAGDPQEVNSVTSVFCTKDRQGPLLIGSTKSNMGHPEPASGLAALAKVLIAMEDGAIPANLHYREPNTDILGLMDGRLKVVSERTKWNGGYVGINSFGFGGSNVHVLLKSNFSGNKPPTVHPASEMARLATCSSRSKEGAEKVLNEVLKEPKNVQMQVLVQESLGSLPASTHPYRGTAILNATGPLGGLTVEKVPSEKRPIWFIFAGMGTQWSGMGRDLMCIKAFKQSIMRSDAVLRQFNVHLYDLLMTSTDDTFNDTLYSFISIAAIQVALVEVLRSLNIEPDGIVGHSVGELGCAYADGALTAEETVLAAYWRGRCVAEAKLPPGGMAAVGLTWAEAKRRCPEGVVPACHNSADTVTISGPTKEVSSFVAQLQSEGIFAKEVKSAGVAFHSRYMAMIAPALKENLERVIRENRRRSSRWISSSIPESDWNKDLALYSSADYHVNNLISPVLFQEALQKVPSNAVVIEIAPHCLLQAILKRSLGSECTFVGLMHRSQANNLEYLLSSLAKLYQSGMDFNPLLLYPGIAYPVDPGTPMLSSLVQWDHSISWDVPRLDQFASGGSGSTASATFNIDISPDSEDEYLSGHMIDGRVLFPATGYLVLAWRVLAKMTGQSYEQLPVTFEDVHIHRATILPPQGNVKLDVTIAPATGRFEVSESNSLVASGRVFVPVTTFEPEEDDSPSDDLAQLNSGDIYKELRLRGYDYGPSFQGICSADELGTRGELLWNDNWISFLDAMLQMQVIGLPGRDLRLPTRIRTLTVDPVAHQKFITATEDGKQIVKVQNIRTLGTCVAGCIEILGLHATVAPRRQTTQAPPIFEQYSFEPYKEIELAREQTKLVSYAEHCCRYVQYKLHELSSADLINGLKNQNLIKYVLLNEIESENFDSDNSLMRVFSQIFAIEHDANFAQNLDRVVSTELSNLHADAAFGFIRNERCLKSCLDIVVENCCSESGLLKIVEFGASIGRVYEQAVPHLASEPGLNLKYSVTGSGLDSLDVDVIERFGLQSIPWNMDDSSTPPNQLSGVDVVVLGNVLHQQKNISHALSVLSRLVRDGGFLLVLEPTKNFALPWCLFALTRDVSYISDLEDRSCGFFCHIETWRKIFEENNLEVISEKSDGLFHTAFLLRKMKSHVATDPVIIDVQDQSFSWVEDIKTAVASEENQVVWLKCEEMPQSGVVGLVNCLRREPDGGKLRCIFNASHTNANNFSSTILNQVVKKDLVMNVFRDGVWGSFRHMTMVPAQEVETELAYVNVITRGDLSTLKWIESPLKYYDSEQNVDKDLCTVYYTSLNFRDIMLATGKLLPDAIPGDLASQDCLLGMEFSGRTSVGKRVMGLLPAKGLATVVDVNKRFLWEIPEAWTMEQAATVPVAYSTAYYALVIRGQIRRNESVLIHSGSGAVGQAAISIALHRGCRVFTTVGSTAKKVYLMERFPQLKEENFANSRDSLFWKTILKSTRGRGVDVVLNSLAEDKLQSSVQLLAQHGRFLEIGKFDLSNDSPLGMAIFLRNIAFHGILLDALFTDDSVDWQTVSDLMTTGIRDGVVVPLQTTVFERDDIESAFRFMAQGKHVGKVVVKVREEEEELLDQKAKPIRLPALQRTYCHPQKSYLIVGGLGGFGLELANWLIDRGARKLVLTSRSGVRSGYQSRRITQWRRAGITVVVSTKNAANPSEAEDLIRECNALGKLGGVFNLAMVLLDGILTNQTPDRFLKVAAPKVQGTQNLDESTRRHCNDSLDWFVVYSSVSCGRGNAGQSNYGYSNSVMERICEKRRHDGFPGLAIQWGAVGDVGVVIDSMGTNETVIGGTLPQRITSCLAALDVFLGQESPVVSSFVLAEKTRSKSQKTVKTSLRDAVARILGIKDSSSVNSDVTLGDLGLDSLMSVEIKQTLERDYDLSTPAKDIRLLTFGALDALSNSSTAVMPKSPVHTRRDYLRYKISDILPTENVVKMNDTSSDRTALFVIHPIEGSVVLLNDLMARLSCPVYGLQCTSDVPLTSIEEMASHYIQQIKSISPEGPYRLAGYSFGACIALEMALQLQRSSDVVERIFLLDGSHQFVTSFIDQHRSVIASGSTADVETQMICAFVDQIAQRLGDQNSQVVDISELAGSVRTLSSLEERLDVMTGDLRKASVINPENSDDVKQAARSFYKKLGIAYSYKPASMLENIPVHLIRASQSSSSASEDYGLSSLSKSPVTIDVVEGMHDTFIRNDGAEKVAEIISKKLSTQ